MTTQASMLEEQSVLTSSLRQRAEQHRKDPKCSVCHEKMDPLGFAMENFDAVRRFVPYRSPSPQDRR